ncbi:TM0106 family RecB-like putative nuclease [Leucobacter tardus]|uniref:TM0106 family RecB-like putative nuclease n=1 Tax=Leucobacter tardus TaxID=501483 RepID=A0A939QDT1_9MICO|nr:bifunctional RecB family nuclease/DEAD/DEAH box helicase [Leucobacter tardus]MBO2990302.1 TM0106 family RecB-like putative nuclease [Leucobacter tardus]
MFLQQARLVTSASDLTAASACEFAFLRRVDAKLGRDVEVPPDDDPMLARAARLGDAHEARVLEEYRRARPGAVVEIPRPESMREPDLVEVAEQTVHALHAGSDVVFQATFFEPVQRAPQHADEPEIAFVGFADFLVRTAEGRYEVQDTKLARRAKVTALMQLAAYAEQLERVGVPVAANAALILGDGSRSEHRIADIAPVFRARRARLHEVLLARVAASAPIDWTEPGITRCGRCEVCEPEIERTRDPLLIAGIRASQRDRLVAAGYATIDEVAQWSGGQVDGMPTAAVARLAAQATAQVRTERERVLVVETHDASALAAIPEPDPGDLFFDFEGDPLFRDRTGKWGIDYLFGMVDSAQQFTPIWAHDLDEERRALERFLHLVGERRRRFPGMHIYHYAAYERTHLLSIAARHGVGEAAVDQLLRDHVLVDLYPIVRRALGVGSRSYSIKKLEPLYMGAELRDESGVTSGAQSVAEYADAMALRASANPEDRAEGQRRLDGIGDYNRYDCVSTLRLRDWLRGIAVDHGVVPYPPEESAEDGPELVLSRIGARLTEQSASATDPADRRATALAASAIDYHQREQKSFWWAHFARLIDPIEEWADTRDVLVVDAALSRVDEGWHVPPRARAQRRIVRLGGTFAPGSTVKVGGRGFLVYDHPGPFRQRGGAPGARVAREVTVVERHADGVTVMETLPPDTRPYDRLPVALTPGTPPPAGAQKSAIEEWGSAYSASLDLDASGGATRDPVVDLLRRTPPRLVGGRQLIDAATEEALRSAAGDEEARTVAAVTESVRRLDRSALAVQGPPGTGKTYLAAHVIRRLVSEHGWRIGVVAQSHKVVEHVLGAVTAAGLPKAQVGKVPQVTPDDPDDLPFTAIRRGGHASFVTAHLRAGRGCVIGGTAWDFSNETRFARRSLDLLVIDEAGQFSLAPTIAASVSAQRLLLLGDPQQLPQVSQGSHPEPVDTSALGWLLDDHGTMPSELGYFLAETRRMRPELATVVSELAYDGRLVAHPTATRREVVGAGPPGLTWHPVGHTGNATSSVEEAAEVVRIARHALESDAVAPRDIIVVAAYNAQVECLVEALERAGLPEIPVGTVDRFQGQEAVIAIVSLAASSAQDAPRGLDFLLMRNRLNVAISRAQWATHLVGSATLGDGLPTTAEGVAALSGFLRLTEAG